MSAATPRRRRMSRADRERQMLDVAEEVFGERGFRATSMDEIAERCGVSKPMLYEYFGSKEGLLRASIARSKEELHDVTLKAVSGATTPRDILWQGMVAYFTFVDSHSKSFTMLLQQPVEVPAETAGTVEATRVQQSELIYGVLALFAPDAPRADLEAYTEIIIGASERLALWRAARPEVGVEDAARYMTEFCWNGLSPYVPDPGEAPPAPR
ncbi:TetR/AcrR family transcriptional regulator [Spirillospora sp. CA-294931]|uniref:TetR/AcrR family transcriptional regulator n=1 Tax=Spirillospora sp. CA-294931 TaxID=3240042 RepID=UPI003D8D5463